MGIVLLIIMPSHQRLSSSSSITFRALKSEREKEEINIYPTPMAPCIQLVAASSPFLRLDKYEFCMVFSIIMKWSFACRGEYTPVSRPTFPFVGFGGVCVYVFGEGRGGEGRGGGEVLGGGGGGVTYTITQLPRIMNPAGQTIWKISSAVPLKPNTKSGTSSMRSSLPPVISSSWTGSTSPTPTAIISTPLSLKRREAFCSVSSCRSGWGVCRPSVTRMATWERTVQNSRLKPQIVIDNDGKHQTSIVVAVLIILTITTIIIVNHYHHQEDCEWPL